MTVHLWTVDLDRDVSIVSALLDVLSGDERVRAARMRTTESRLRFIVAHGALRAILARYAGVSASAIRLESSDTGKPFVADASISFNLTHSEGIAVCAISPDGRIGVDVERIRPLPDADAIVTRYFAPGEASEYASLPPAQRPAAFFSTWTRKEAFVKAIGDGLTCPLRSFEVEIAPAAIDPRIVTDPARGEWYLRSFEPAPGYAGAVACDNPIDQLQHFAFDDVACIA
ncbi:MAG: 4'-phosphopantetheinyl transferase family protein [Vicinamibacterales bacterium]